MGLLPGLANDAKVPAIPVAGEFEQETLLAKTHDAPKVSLFITAVGHQAD
jgi:hypothetical protein